MRVCICLGGVIAGYYFSCKENKFQRECKFSKFSPINMEIASNFEAGKFIGTHK